MQGDLSRESLADVIRSVYVDRRSGILHLAQSEVSKRIYFRKGSMIFANSDVDSDRLGEFLIANGWLDRAGFDKASELMKETGHRFGRTLVEMGHFDAEEMQGKVVAQIEAIIYSLFLWESGDYRFEQHENPVDEDIVLNLSTADIILQGIRQMEDIDKVRRALGDTDRVLQHSENPLLLYQKISLNPSEGFVLSRIDGMSTVADIAAISPLGEDETLKCVYGLVSAGVLELGGATRSQSEQLPPPEPEPVAEPAPEPKPAAAPAAPPRTRPEPERVVSKPAPPPPPKPAARPVEIPKPEAEPLAAAEASAQPEGPSPEETAIRDDILQKHASLSEVNLYGLLGITITASDSEIKKAYYAMAKKYHPDRHHSPHLRDIHHLLEELFVKITHAYQTLSSPMDRHRYDSTVRHEEGGGVGVHGEAGNKAEEKSEAARKRHAEERYAEGKRHFEEMHFFDAIQCLREAVRLYPKKSYHKLLAQSLMKNPLWVKEAEEHFRKALKMDQFDADCYLGLGDIYDAAGMTTRAQKMYEQAATYSPDDEEVLKRLGKKSEGGGLGGFKRIFGRKKE